MINYKELLKKYMMLVVDAESIDYVGCIGDPITTKLVNDAFSQEEISVLETISKEVHEELYRD